MDYENYFVTIRGVSKKFGELYKQNRRYKQMNFIDLQNNRHPPKHTVGNVHKASGNYQQRPQGSTVDFFLFPA
jgi:hypothetical protein